MSAVDPEESVAKVLQDLPIGVVKPNVGNPRLDFPMEELEKLAESIALEGVLVPVVVYADPEAPGTYILIDGERRFRCARELALETVPAVITSQSSEREMLQQMFNIHHIRERWRDMPTAIAIGRLVEAYKADEEVDLTDAQLRDMTGLSIERIRQLRYVLTLPTEWQEHIRTGEIPLNYFWEVKRNVLDLLERNRPQLLEALGRDNVAQAFVDKRLNDVITDTVSVRKIAPIIRFAAADAENNEDGTSTLDQAIADLVQKPEATIEDAYEETVYFMVELDKLERRVGSMVAAFRRLLDDSSNSDEDRASVVATARSLAAQLTGLVEGREGAN